MQDDVICSGYCVYIFDDSGFPEIHFLEILEDNTKSPIIYETDFQAKKAIVEYLTEIIQNVEDKKMEEDDLRLDIFRIGFVEMYDEGEYTLYSFGLDQEHVLLESCIFDDFN